MSTSVYETIKYRLVDKLKSSSLASIAGVDDSDWSASNGHVFVGDGGFIGARNRGRCPFVEIIGNKRDFLTQWSNGTSAGGTVKSTWVLRLHIAVRDQDTAQTFGEVFLSEALAEIRSTTDDVYFYCGNEDQISMAEQSPFGYQMEATITLEHTFDRLDYGVDGG